MHSDTATPPSNAQEVDLRSPWDSAQSELELSICGTDHQPARIRLTDTGCVIDPDMTFDEWKDGLKAWKWMQTKIKLGFADYIRFGEIRFTKEACDQALQQLEFDLPTITSAIQINSVPPELRYPNLQAEHYVVLARSDMPIKQKIKWAKISSVQQLTPGQLKASMAAGEVVSTATANGRQHGVLTFHGIIQEFSIMMKRVGGIEGILKMKVEEREDLLALLSEPHLCYVAIKESLTAKPAKKKSKPAKKKAKPAKSPAKKKAKK